MLTPPSKKVVFTADLVLLSCSQLKVNRVLAVLLTFGIESTAKECS